MDVLNAISSWTSVTPASTANAASSVDFSLSFTTAQLTVKRGACGSGPVVLTRLNGFAGTPSFTCTAAAGLGATTCAVVPVVSAAFEAPGDYRELGWWGAVGVPLAGVALVLASFGRSETRDRESRAWPRVVPGYVLMGVLAVVAGCRGTSTTNTSPSPNANYSFSLQVPSTAPAASGTITVNAAIGGINHP